MSSDYGDEIEWDDTLETQLQALESAPLLSSNTGPRRVEVTLEAPPTASTSAGLQPTATVLEEALAALEGMEEQPQRKKSLWCVCSLSTSGGQANPAATGSGTANGVDGVLYPSLTSSAQAGAKYVRLSSLALTPLTSFSPQVQHAYRLGSKAHLPPSLRPTEIISSNGASIPLDLKRTVAREIILDKGKGVHMVLEKEVMGDAEPVKVAVVGKEEWWALRLLNTMVALETLLETGRAVSGSYARCEVVLLILSCPLTARDSCRGICGRVLGLWSD